MHEEIKQITKNLKEQMAKVTVLQNQAMANLSDEKRQEMAPISKDLTRATNAMKEGNSEVLNDLLNKYARTNR